ncbi:hypothetical protein STEG23_015509 [Scotinomys teguina]
MNQWLLSTYPDTQAMSPSQEATHVQISLWPKRVPSLNSPDLLQSLVKVEHNTSHNGAQLGSRPDANYSNKTHRRGYDFFWPPKSTKNVAVYINQNQKEIRKLGTEPKTGIIIPQHCLILRLECQIFEGRAYVGLDPYFSPMTET